ncbi:diaminopimelate decarboxylase [Halosquirtibacter xylanolyticus]|uniref:diaminopimelate decarboxylase n=1 Tax=Halosquirtibacter xylanolyticus TaxID=3374599 RepID=UPI00374943F8|nr:diaminopimelate decarboxylase [Prolixibacteraceae bacterium]
MINRELLSKLTSKATPYYFYDTELLRKTIQEIKTESNKYGYQVHYALKANTHDGVVKEIVAAGFGADCVSGNEVSYAHSMGIPSERIAFAGVGKTDHEILTALRVGIFSFNCESIPEIEVINDLAAQEGVVAPIAIRINPDVDPKTHEYITTGLKDNKFGINHWDFDVVAERLKSLDNIELTGIHFHVGSQIMDMTVFEQLSLKINKIAAWFKENDFHLHHINVGGGLGINYEAPVEAPVADFKGYFKAFHDHIHLEEGQELHFELGRSVVAQCGHLISKVLYVKQGLETQFMILDAGMTELIRPALYGAHHDISVLTSDLSREKYDVVGPVCESSDVFAKGVMLPKSKRGDIVAIHSSGAYGQTMASSYNMRDLVKGYTTEEL